MFPSNKVLASGWWSGLYWIMVDEPDHIVHPIYWFPTALHALLYMNGGVA